MTDIPIPNCFTGLPWTCGLSGAVYFITDRAVIKRPFSNDKTSQEQLNLERRIYERLGKHPRITAFLDSPQPDTILLERMQYTLRNLQQQPATQDAKRWALQTAEGLYYIHSRGVKQVDIGTYNVLLDGEENAKLSNFVRFSLDGSRPTIAPSVHATHPRLSIVEPTVQSELFALGSLLYEVETTRKPFEEKREDEVEVLFEVDEYPATSGLVLRDGIRKCWTMGYRDVGEVVIDIEAIQICSNGDG